MLEFVIIGAVSFGVSLLAEKAQKTWIHGPIIAVLVALVIFFAFQGDVISVGIFLFLTYCYVQEYNLIVSERRKHGSES